MIKCVNRVTLLGKVFENPIRKETVNSNKRIVHFTLVTKFRYKNRDTGFSNESSHKIRITAFKRLSDVVEESVREGDYVYVEGYITTWVPRAEDPEKFPITEVIATSVSLFPYNPPSPEEGFESLPYSESVLDA